MEHSPISTEESEDTSEKKDSKKKKKAESLGSFALKPERVAEQSESKDKEPSFWDKLTKQEEPKPEKSETDAPAAAKQERQADQETLEELTGTEPHIVEQALVRAASEASAEANPTDEAEALGEEKVQEFRSRILDGSTSDEALEVTLGSMEQTDGETIPEEVAETETEELPADAREEPVELEPGEIRLTHDDAEAPEPDAGGAGYSGSTRAGGSIGGSSGSSGRGSDSSRSGGNAGRPPVPPVPPTPPGGGAVPPAGGGFGGRRFGGMPAFAVAAPNLVPNLAPGAVSPPVPAERYYDPGNPAAAALVGGVIGYLIGRRRGGIKTEKKLQPVQNKLRKEVAKLEYQLQVKEQRIRKAAREQFRLENELDKRPREVRVPEAVVPVAAAAERLDRPARIAAPEASQVHGKREQQEHLGHMVVTAEAVRRQEAEKPKVEAPKITKHVETLNRAELMAISEKIYVDGSNLKQIYDTRLVGEKGLRRLVAEHLRGGNLKKVLRREIVEREIDFERDPVMRDSIGPSGGGATGGAPSPKLDTLLKKANVDLQADTDEVAFLKAKSRYENERKVAGERKRKLVDAGMVATITTLIILVAYLYLTR